MKIVLKEDPEDMNIIDRILLEIQKGYAIHQIQVKYVLLNYNEMIKLYDFCMMVMNDDDKTKYKYWGHLPVDKIYYYPIDLENRQPIFSEFLELFNNLEHYYSINQCYIYYEDYYNENISKIFNVEENEDEDKNNENNL